MTRESKIALLVGLGFIICFGLILNESRSGAPPQAVPDMRIPVNVSGVESLTARRLERAEPAPARLATVDRVEDEPKADALPAVGAQAAPPRTQPRFGQPDPVEHIVRTVTPEPTAPRIDATPTAREKPTAETEAMGLYIVAPGDTLYGIAAKVYGPDNAGEYDRIFQANRDTLKDPGSVRVGQKLTIPVLPDRPEPAAASHHDAMPNLRVLDADELRRELRAAERQASAPPAERTYTVRPGDNLTRIARRTLNSDSRDDVRRLFEANRDILSDPNSVRVGMELKIPR